ncbi:MAG: 23S rRNA (adenine(2503)-C(2))-methyltransferase RlmN [Chlorobiaceae bacterium]|nr:23S rRNA (adenine(2503)-C(2))-methyltransferase RlmN [Chlorobiaceae bacterium]NTW74756.1 23S rRNA (adenine(2503)-C(2))-methyltransferase RlmN [Chlorobiaceae bacterium]
MDAPHALPNIKEFTREQLGAVVAGLGEPKFRADQLHRWLYSQGASDFDSMSSISASLRRKLSSAYDIRSVKIESVACGTPGQAAEEESPTVKYLLRLPDDELVESVLIPSGERITACVSSQAGCPLQCEFCATGHMGFRRNLHASEITDQVYALQDEAALQSGGRITNIVFMGMGEPLLNLQNVMEAVATLTAKDYRFSIAEKRITISTVGLVPGIERLASSGLKTKLAVSLHSADQELRERLMPVARQYPLEDLGKAIDAYNRMTGLPVTLVYMLIDGVNDSPGDARKLARFAKRFLCKINLIDYNSIVNFQFRPAHTDTRNTFVRQLLDNGLIVTVRKSQGAAINAACGQLATRPGPTAPNRSNH